MLYSNQIAGVTDDICDDVFTALADNFDQSEWIDRVYRDTINSGQRVLVWEDADVVLVDLIQTTLGRHNIRVADDINIYTYTADMHGPMCPECGSPVNPDTQNPERPSLGTCCNGHTFLYSLDVEEEEIDG